jgi:hypothetical protein
VFCWTRHDAWPGDFMEPTPPMSQQLIMSLSPGTVPAPVMYAGADYDDCGIDTAGLVLYMGHGNPVCFTFTHPDWTPMDGGSAYNLQLDSPGRRMAATYWKGDCRYFLNLEGSWGSAGPNQFLCWLAFFSCGVLQYNLYDPFDYSAPGSTVGSANYAWRRWGGAFNGLHVMLGYHTSVCSSPLFGTPATFAMNMLGYRVPVQTIVQAWINASDSTQFQYTYVDAYGHVHPPVVAAAMGPLGPFGVWNFDDYYPGKGSMGPSIVPPISGWWYVNRHTGIVRH